MLVRIVEQASARGDLDHQDADEAFDDAPFVDLLDALVVESDPRGARLLELHARARLDGLDSAGAALLT